MTSFQQLAKQMDPIYGVLEACEVEGDLIIRFNKEFPTWECWEWLCLVD